MQVGHKGLAPPLHWRGSLFACMRIVWISWFLWITSRGLYKPLQISCCSCWESLRILADRSRSFSICFSESLLIHADLPRSICWGAAIWVPIPTSAVWEIRWVFFHWSGSVRQCQLAAACRGGSHSQGCHGHHPALAWSAQAPYQHLRHQFPSSSIGNEFKQGTN